MNSNYFMLFTILVSIFLLSGCVSQQEPTQHQTTPPTETAPVATNYEPDQSTDESNTETSTPTETATITEPIIIEPEDKFVLWQQPSFFRGAVMHPYGRFDDAENRIYATKQDFIALRKQGANVVSLNYHGPFQSSPPYEVEEEQLQFLDDGVQWSQEAGLYAIIHLRAGPGRPAEVMWGDPYREDESLWYSDEAQQQWTEMWKFVAERYKEKQHIIAYNLMVEPHPETPVTQQPKDAAVWNALSKRITNAIREVDRDTPIIISSTHWANPQLFADLAPTGDARTIYSFHMYEPTEFTHQGFEEDSTAKAGEFGYPGEIPSAWKEGFWDKKFIDEFLNPVTQFQEENNVPIFIGEYGCNQRIASCPAYLDDLMSIFEEHGWSYTFYEWREGNEKDFDYEREVGGSERVPESQYMKLFKKFWSKNGYGDAQ